MKLGPDIRPSLICNLQGIPFTESGYRSNWHRLMQKAVAKGAITEPFTFHDLRAKSAGDAGDPEEATEPLAHDDRGLRAPCTCVSLAARVRGQKY